MEPGFDDSKWYTGMLPFSWHINYSLVARAAFDVRDKTAVSALRVSMRPFRQQNIVVYINGKIVAKFNQCGSNKGWVHGDLTAKALTYLRNGKNTIASQTTGNVRERG